MCSSFGAAAWAGRPLTVDDATTVNPGDLELEAGLVYQRDSGVRHVETPVGLAFGLPARLELGASFGWQWEQRQTTTGRDSENDVSDLVVGLKWNPFPAEQWWAGHALAASVKIPTANKEEDLGSGRADYDLMYIVTKTITAQISADLNIGHTWVGGDDDVLHYGLAVRWQTTNRIEWVAEIVADTVLASANDTAVSLNGGVRWTVSDTLILDAAAGGGLNKHAPDWTATIGLTWVFGFSQSNR